MYFVDEDRLGVLETTFGLSGIGHMHDKQLLFRDKFRLALIKEFVHCCTSVNYLWNGSRI